MTLGVSGDFFHEQDGIGYRDQANPKGGITWNPSFSPGTTFRAAGFRELKRTLVNQQTLEPTQVAGFNQFYDDPSGTSAWRYGVAVDQKFGSRVFAGLEGSWRDLQVPHQIAGITGTVTTREPAREKLARTYLFVTPFDWIALRAEYQFEQFRREQALNFAFTKLDTHRVPLGVQLFHPSGISVSSARPISTRTARSCATRRARSKRGAATSGCSTRASGIACRGATASSRSA
jgi:hypothetical protein